MAPKVTAISIIVSTYNEKDNLPFLLYLIRREVLKISNLQYEIVIVDDSSPDGTRAVALRLQQVLPDVRIKLVERPYKMGLGSSYIDALKHCAYDFVVIIDADLSHHPRYIADLVGAQRAAGLDVVFASRYGRGGGASGWPLRRVFISKAINYLVRVLFGTKVTDVTGKCAAPAGSYRLYHKRALARAMAAVKNRGFLFQLEVALRCEKRLGCRVGEVPIVFTERVLGASKLGK